MFDTYTASDYAGLSGGEYDFYYGYEVTDDDDNWLFVAKVGNEECEKWTAAELGVDQFDDPYRVLMRGVAKFLDQVESVRALQFERAELVRRLDDALSSVNDWKQYASHKSSCQTSVEGIHHCDCGFERIKTDA